ncbi:GNAT family N-acetyltransferase [Wenxinia marina]|uniref:Acetyltransferase n=1 Tax=Wenxinia marina DSM 24838 TaxID=1123501 RepID=A0A0D0Q6B6_9RHOB|nr:GNAT family N-acetyltransferase [Wenxinia marina]KIQ68002.1 Acetyltransferase [Wenxinia marina DSM 24838]GGL75477.1 N-acetyltransferase [Wenxinia marina]
MIELLETPRLILRRPEAKDWDAARAFFTSDRAAGIGGPLSEGAAWRAFAAEIGHWAIRGYGMWAVTLRGEDRAVGLVGPWYPVDWPETEVGWMIWDPAIEGTGIATEAAHAAIRHAYDGLGWDTVVSYIDLDNARSIRLAEKLGAVHDPAARVPNPDKPCRVYRHPRPAEDAA